MMQQQIKFYVVKRYLGKSLFIRKKIESICVLYSLHCIYKYMSTWKFSNLV